MKISETKSWLYEKINQIDKPLEKMTKNRHELSIWRIKIDVQLQKTLIRL